MLQIKNISKKYVTGDLTQIALNDVSLNLRDNEFVAILGPSGSGKTTLLNVIGGLDRYDSGDLIINGISTKKYKDKDWDSYRNHTIGFVFQSYNLINHQSVLSNVELALTISGISKANRKQRAIDALDQVGLKDHIYKKPNQLSGGQMQRVAIARALINDPDILLADEPTGALDTETSIQVMKLLKEVAKDRLVVMVTHNPELAHDYASRIVSVKDGKIINDSDQFNIDENTATEAIHKNMGKSSMSYLTSLSLSFNNLKTKKARTLLTAFAGSIGIIGIALILSLSNGVNSYIAEIQRSTMSSYPITIEEQAIDLSGIMATNPTTSSSDLNHELDGIYSNSTSLQMMSEVTSKITENNLTEFKKYLDDESSEIHNYIANNGIVYSYNTKFGMYTFDPNNSLVLTNATSELNSSISIMANPSVYQQLLPNTETGLVGDTITENFDLLYGNWPNAYNEVVLSLDKNNEIATSTLYSLGFLPASEYEDLMEKLTAGEAVTINDYSWSYEELVSQKFYMLPDCDLYELTENGTYKSIATDTDKLQEKVTNAIEITITGIMRAKNDDASNLFSGTIGYTKALTDYVIDYSNNSEVVKSQIASSETNILNGMTFSPSDDEVKKADTIKYIEALGVSDKAKLFKDMIISSYGEMAVSSGMMEMSEIEMANMLDQFIANPDDETLIAIYDKYISSGDLDTNLQTLGVINLDAPSSINIYAESFEAKDSIAKSITAYNETVGEEYQITYTDFVGLLMSSITTIINVISYVLIAFVGVSLVVSSIMIGIITYISVLERTKEIGILRAIGASKRNISQVFNAETFIIGLFSGVLGVLITILLNIPISAIIHVLVGTNTVNATLPIGSAVILIIISVILTLIGGFIPAKKAAKKDPVTALRSD